MRYQHRPKLPLHDIVAPSSTSSSSSSSARSLSLSQHHYCKPSPTAAAAAAGSDAQRMEQCRKPLPALERINSVLARNKQSEREENSVANALARRAYHLPGYGYCADWSQYLVNNHMMLGMFCRHPKHPIRSKIRAINLLGSALFGLAVTNIIWLGYIYYDEDPESVMFKISFQGDSNGRSYDSWNGTAFEDDMMMINGTTGTATGTHPPTQGGPSFEIILPGPKDEATAETLGNTLKVTKGMLLLWTVGGCLHAVYDSLIWHASACTCCLPGNRCESLGFMRHMSGYFIIFTVVLVTALASFAVVLRATLMSHEEIDASILQSAGFVDDAIHVGEDLFNDLGVFEFVIGYFVEFVLALFVYYPLFATIMFTGVLDCLGLPGLGGRPREMRREARNNSNATNT